jgi:signal transduction histidine kinase
MTLPFKRHIILLFFLLTATFVSGQTAQLLSHLPESPQKEQIISAYSHLRVNLFNSRTIALADSVIRLGVQLHLPTISGLAYVLKMQYMWQTCLPKDENKLKRNVKEGMDFCQKYGDTKHYFQVWNSLVFFYIQKSMNEKAIAEISKFMKEAEEKGSDEFVAWGWRSLANMYYMQHRYEAAIEAFVKAAEIAEKIKDYGTVNYCYSIASTVCIRQERYDRAIPFIQLSDEALSKMKVLPIGARSVYYSNLGICYYYLGYYERTQQMYEKLKKINWWSTRYDVECYYTLKAYDLITKGDYKGARLAADSINSSWGKEKVCDIVYIHEQMYKEATENLTKMLNTNKQLFKQGEESESALKQMMFDMNNSEHQSSLLERRNQQLALNSKLSDELAHRISLEKVNIDRNYELNNAQVRAENIQQGLLFEKQKHENTLKKLQMQRQYRDAVRVRDMTLTTVAVAIIIILVCLLAWYRWSIRRLRKEEEETEKASVEAEQLHCQAEKDKELAQEADRLKTEFIESFSYEVRTPLNAIVGFASLLTQDNVTEADKNYYKDLIEKNSNSLSVMVNDILDLAKLQTGKYKILYAPVAVYELCSSPLEEERKNVKAGVEMTMHVADELKDKLTYTDMRRVSHALRNILNNACHHTESGSIVLDCHFEQRENKPFIVFSVTNTGISIPADKADAIFERFVKLDRYSSGNGLGLAISRVIAQKLDGECWLDTSYREATRFVFEIPYLEKNPEGGES